MPGSSATPAHLVTGVWLGNDDSSPTRKATGGGLPVEIWSRFMKSAHQNVAVAGLPGLSGNTVLRHSGADIARPDGGAAAGRASGAAIRGPGLDNWLLDRLFGRR